SGTQAICSNGSTTFTSNGDAGSWTSGSTGVATINSSTGAITPVAAGTSTITYTVTGTGGCSNATATRDVTVTTAPDSPTGSASQSFCSASSPTIANLSATGTSIQWYAAPSGGSALSSSSSLSDGSIYYASQTTSGCESTSRFAVTSTVTTNPSAPTGSASQSFCSASSPTIASLNATGTSIQWYAASSGGSALSSSSSLSDGSIYYASQTTSGCESSSRFAVTATVTASGTWIGDSNDNWNDANNWCGGIPNSNSVVVSIPSGVTVNLDFSASVLDLTIASGSTLNMGGNTISIADGGSFTNDGTFNAGTGTISFSGNGSISGSSTTFNSLIVNGVLSMNTSPTVNGTVTINAGGSISSNPVVYGSSASLVYNLNSSFTTTNNEWPTSNSPRNVTVQNNSQVTLNSAKEIAGNLNLTNGIINSTSTNLLTIGSNTATLGSINWTSGTIIGPVKRWFGTAANSTQASGIFPVGIAGQNRLAIINFTQTTDGGYILMEYKTGAPNNSTPSNPFGLPMSYVSNGQTNYIQNADLTGYWDITPYSATGVAYDALDNNTFDITLRINSDVIQANPVTANPPGMRIIRAKGNPSAPHDPFEIGATAAIITQVPGSDPGEDFFVRSNGLTGFSWFNIGGDNETPLPVELSKTETDVKGQGPYLLLLFQSMICRSLTLGTNSNLDLA
ncbi:MAG: hypothetical protein EBU01_11105, partial [Crocinitomicaceae bacterium]|nr:hypothetical protein [Crocinitomicaceae bacterium]